MPHTPRRHDIEATRLREKREREREGGRERTTRKHRKAQMRNGKITQNGEESIQMEDQYERRCPKQLRPSVSAASRAGSVYTIGAPFILLVFFQNNSSNHILVKEVEDRLPLPLTIVMALQEQ